MTDNEIIKALECCAKGTTSDVCLDCPLIFSDICTEEENGVTKLALDLINHLQARIEKLQESRRIKNKVIFEQQAEIERLQELLEGWKTEAYKVADEKDKLYCNAVERVKTAKAEAIEEFAEMLKDRAEAKRTNAFDWGWFINDNDIDNLVKEMVGEE